MDGVPLLTNEIGRIVVNLPTAAALTWASVQPAEIADPVVTLRVLPP
jgi:hypothetical protein